MTLWRQHGKRRHSLTTTSTRGYQLTRWRISTLQRHREMTYSDDVLVTCQYHEKRRHYNITTSHGRQQL